MVDGLEMKVARMDGLGMKAKRGGFCSKFNGIPYYCPGDSRKTKSPGSSKILQRIDYVVQETQNL